MGLNSDSMNMTEKGKTYWDNYNEKLYKEYLEKKAKWRLKQQIMYN